MAFESNSPNMLLPIPGVGLTAGPTYATDINNCLTIIDQHNHSNGSGVQITPSGLNINADLLIGSNNLLSVKTTRYVPQPSALASPNLGALYVVGKELCYTDTTGAFVPLTNNGSVAGTNGSIGGLTSPASLNYSAGTFVFQSNTNTAANLDAESYILRNSTASSHGLTLQPPNAMTFDYTLTLPSPPTAAAFLTLDTSGNITGSIPQANGITFSMLIAAVQQALCPAGSLSAYGGATAPSGWLLCNGAAVSRTTYAALFTAIGTTFGVGDGSTTFNVPNTLTQVFKGSNSSQSYTTSPSTITVTTTYDTFSAFSTGVFTAPYNSYYEVQLNGNANGQNEFGNTLYYRINGGTWVAMQNTNYAGGLSAAPFNASTILLLNKADTLELGIAGTASNTATIGQYIITSVDTPVLYNATYIIKT